VTDVCHGNFAGNGRVMDVCHGFADVCHGNFAGNGGVTDVCHKNFAGNGGVTDVRHGNFAGNGGVTDVCHGNFAGNGGVTDVCHGNFVVYAGVSTSVSESKSAFASFAQEDDTTIQIGMAAAKVSITRPWFNPGVFVLTSDMYNVSNLRVSPENDDSAAFVKDGRLRDMYETVFPCFPVAFVIAKDVSIKITTKTSVSQQAAEQAESHAASGGGFFIFHGSQSSSRSSGKSSSNVTSDSKSVTIRFKDPQILGWYLEATPADHSVLIDPSVEEKADAAGFVSIMAFVKAYKNALKDYALNVKGK
jgi:hypothetical protein